MRLTYNAIVIHGNPQSTDPAKQHAKGQSIFTHLRDASSPTVKTADGTNAVALLTLHPTSHTLASEWIDGLLMLLSQEPITPETKKLIEFIAGYSLRIRLLNVRNEETVGVPGEAESALASKHVTIPSREGLDEDFFYRVLEM